MKFVRKKEANLLRIQQIEEPVRRWIAPWYTVESEAKSLNDTIRELFNSNVRVKPARRYSYTAIDMYVLKDGEERMIDTLVAGLTKTQAYEFLRAFRMLLENINKYKA